jgi:hypothetical protein
MIEYLENILYKNEDLPGNSDKNVQFMDKIKKYNQTHKNYLEVAEEPAEKDDIENE